jgi:hypothetical protein
MKTILFLLCLVPSVFAVTVGETLLSLPKTTTITDSTYLWTRTSTDTTSRKVSMGTVVDFAADSISVTGTFLDTITGMDSVITGTVKWCKVGKIAYVQIPAQTGTSNSTACTFTTLPATIRPATAQLVSLVGAVEDAGVITNGQASIGTNGVITLKQGAIEPTATFTNTLVKGWPSTITFGYILSP